MNIVLEDGRFVDSWEVPSRHQLRFPRDIIVHIPSCKDIEQTRLPTSSISAIRVCQKYKCSAFVDLALKVMRPCAVTRQGAFDGARIDQSHGMNSQ